MLLPGVADWRELTPDYSLQMATIIGLYTCMETHFKKILCSLFYDYTKLELLGSLLM